jgi:hypothetical protein
VISGTRRWVYSAPGGSTQLDENADPDQAGLESLAIGSNKRFQDKYLQAGGTNATFESPAADNHSWAYWRAQPQAVQPGLIATLNGLGGGWVRILRAESTTRGVVDYNGTQAEEPPRFLCATYETMGWVAL